jgi:hypothetical protein
VASLHGRGFWSMGLHGMRGVPWDEDNTGLLVERYGSRFEDSWGPAVYVSEWWVREHWGRTFDIERFEPTGFGFVQPENQLTGQAWLVARKPQDARSLTPGDLESPSTDPREARAALRAQRLAYEEVEKLLLWQSERAQGLEAQAADLALTPADLESPSTDPCETSAAADEEVEKLLSEQSERAQGLEAQAADLALTPADLESPSTDPCETSAAADEEVEKLLSEQSERAQGLEAQAADLARRLAVVESSKSWNLTKPLRSIAQQLRVMTRCG